LISDPKYQHINVNVDDDYEEVWQHKNVNQIGNLNFINNTNPRFNSPLRNIQKNLFQQSKYYSNTLLNNI